METIKMYRRWKQLGCIEDGSNQDVEKMVTIRMQRRWQQLRWIEGGNNQDEQKMATIGIYGNNQEI